MNSDAEFFVPMLHAITLISINSGLTSPGESIIIDGKVIETWLKYI